MDSAKKASGFDLEPSDEASPTTGVFDPRRRGRVRRRWVGSRGRTCRLRSSAMRSIRIFLRPTAEGRKGDGRSARGAVRRGRVDRERLTARRSAKRAVGMLDRVGTRTGGGLDRRPIRAEGLGLGALGGIGHGATWVLRSWGSAARTGEARQRVRARRNELSGRQIGGSTPRGPARSRRGGGRGTRGRATPRLHARAQVGALVGISLEASGMPPA